MIYLEWNFNFSSNFLVSYKVVLKVHYYNHNSNEVPLTAAASTGWYYQISVGNPSTVVAIVKSRFTENHLLINDAETDARATVNSPKNNETHLKLTKIIFLNLTKNKCVHVWYGSISLCVRHTV